MSAPEKTLNIAISTKHQAAIHGLGKVTEYTERLVGKVVRLRAVTQQLGGRMTKTTERFNETGKSIGVTTDKVKQLNRGLFKTGDSFGKIIMKVTQWTVATGILFGSVRALKGALDTVVDIDDKMVMLTKVFQGTAEQLARVREEAMRVSVSMGNLVGASVDATTEWAKMGRVGSELSEGLRVSLLGQNIAEIEAADGAKLLNAAMVQFNISMDGAIDILDEWNELSNRTPATTKDLASSVQQAGAIFNSAGASIQDLNAYTAALSSSMAKSGKEIGSALKTIGSYIRRQSSIPKILAATGISIERQGGQLMELDQIVLELAGSWQYLTDIQKEEIAQTAAGVRRKAFFLNLMDNFGLVLENYAIQWEAAGSALRENEIRMDSIKTKLLQLSAAVEKAAIKTGDRGLAKAMKSVVDMTRESVDRFGDLSGSMQLFEIGAGAASTMAARNIIKFGSLTATTVTLTGAMSALSAAMSFAVTKLFPAVGVIVAVGFAIEGLTRMINAEKLALTDLNDERDRRLRLLKNETAAIKAGKQQYETFKSLVTQFEKRKQENKPTEAVMEHIRQVWTAINDMNPDLLAGLTTMKQVLDKLEVSASGAEQKLKDLNKEAFDIRLKKKVSIEFSGAEFREGLEKLIKEKHTDVVVDVFYNERAEIRRKRSVVDELVELARSGDADAAIKLLRELADSLVAAIPKTQTEFELIDNINATINKIEGFKGEIADLEKIITDAFGPEFNADAWDALSRAIDKANKKGADLDDRLNAILNKDKTAAEMFAETGFEGDIKGITFGLKDDLDAIELKIAAMEKVGQLNDKQVELIRLEKVEQDKLLSDYEMMLDIFKMLTNEKDKQVAADKRAANTLKRKEDNELKRIGRLYETAGSNLGEAIGAATEHGFGGDRALGALHSFTTSLGAILEDEISRAVKKALIVDSLKFAGPLGALAGAFGGSLIDILADSLFGEKSQSDKLIDEMDRNTLALQDNTNAFQDFQERLINAPSTFALPALAGDSTSGYGGGDTVDFMSKGIGGSGGGNTSNNIDGLVINIDGSKSPIATGKAVVAAIDKAYSNSDDRGKNLAQDF